MTWSGSEALVGRIGDEVVQIAVRLPPFRGTRGAQRCAEGDACHSPVQRHPPSEPVTLCPRYRPASDEMRRQPACQCVVGLLLDGTLPLGQLRRAPHHGELRSRLVQAQVSVEHPGEGNADIGAVVGGEDLGNHRLGGGGVFTHQRVHYRLDVGEVPIHRWCGDPGPLGNGSRRELATSVQHRPGRIEHRLDRGCAAGLYRSASGVLVPTAHDRARRSAAAVSRATPSPPMLRP